MDYFLAIVNSGFIYFLRETEYEPSYTPYAWLNFDPWILENVFSFPNSKILTFPSLFKKKKCYSHLRVNIRVRF